MSASLVWKSLQLFDADTSKKGGKKSKNPGSNKNYKNLIPTKRHGVKKELKKAKSEDRKLRSTLLGERDALLPSLRRSKSSKSSKEEDKTEQNLQRLKLLSQSPIDLQTAQKLLDRATGNKIELVKEKVDTNTVFTEADFARFAKKYVVD